MKARILIVDDEKEIREMLSRHFKFLDYDVFTAENGKHAIEVLNSERVEIVISDIKMPVMDGIELLRQIRTQFPMIHSIIITGYVTMENLLAALRHGADTCVFKPFSDMLELEKAVEQAVEHLNTWQRKLKELDSIK